MVQYVEIIDQENPDEPNQINIAIELQKQIDQIEANFNVKFKSACFLGEAEAEMEGENSIFQYAVRHDIVCRYMLFFS